MECAPVFPDELVFGGGDIFAAQAAPQNLRGIVPRSRGDTVRGVHADHLGGRVISVHPRL